MSWRRRELKARPTYHTSIQDAEPIDVNTTDVTSSGLKRTSAVANLATALADLRTKAEEIATDGDELGAARLARQIRALLVGLSVA
jgi:hypothetical protein